MKKTIIIRFAQQADVEQITGFNIALAKETENKELALKTISAGVKHLFDHPECGFYVVAEKNSVIAGSLMITKEWSDWRNAEFWWIQSVYVKPEFRRQGVYHNLYEFVKVFATAQGTVCGFRLYVENDNKIAQKTYTKLGMNETNYKMFETVFY